MIPNNSGLTTINPLLPLHCNENNQETKDLPRGAEI